MLQVFQNIGKLGKQLLFSIPGGGHSHMKGAGMLVKKFWIKGTNLIEETNLGVAQPFFDP